MTGAPLAPPTWRRVSDWAEAEINRARVKLEVVGLGPEDTNALRGEIRALKKLLALPSEAAQDRQVLETSAGLEGSPFDD